MTQRVLTGIYRREGDWNLIEMKLTHPAQLFNSMDPSPFRERDLDTEAAEYIVDALRELHGHRHVKIVVWLPAVSDPRTHAAMSDAIHNYFRYRETAALFDVRNILRIGRISLAIGLVFLAACTALWRFVFIGESMFDHVLSEGALIIGWVAMWRPLEILLYDWWPVLRDARLYRRASGIPVELRTGQD